MATFQITVEETAVTLSLLPNKDLYINGKMRRDVGQSFRSSIFFHTISKAVPREISGFR